MVSRKYHLLSESAKDALGVSSLTEMVTRQVRFPPQLPIVSRKTHPLSESVKDVPGVSSSTKSLATIPAPIAIPSLLFPWAQSSSYGASAVLASASAKKSS